MKISIETKRQIIKEYQENKLSYVKIGKKHDISYSSVRDILIKANLFIPKKGFSYTLNEHFFDIIDTEEKAYFLGFLYADGYNNEKTYRVELGLQDRDVSIIEKFNSAIGSNRPLVFRKLYRNNSRIQQKRRQYRLTIVNKQFSQALVKQGCFQAKSLTLQFPTADQVPEHLLRHFVRGYFDGDGTVHTKTGDGYARAMVGMMSSINFCIDLNNRIQNLFGWKFLYDTQYGHSGRLQTGTIPNMRQFLDWMYKDATVYLERKYQKYLDAEKEETTRQTNIKPRERNNKGQFALGQQKSWRF